MLERVLLDLLEHLVDRQHADDLLVQIHDGRRDQVVTLERLGGMVLAVARQEILRLRVHDLGDRERAVADEQLIDRQRALQHVVAIDDRQRRELRRQAAAAAQRRDRVLERHVGAHGDDVELHQRADAALGKRQHRLHFGALRGAELREHGIDAFLRQILDEVREVLGLHLPAEPDQLRLLEQRDERGAHRVGELEQHGAAALARDQLPRRHALLLPQALEHESGVGRVQLIELLLELDGVLPLDERLHERVLARVGARDELMHERLLVEQRNDGAQRRVESLLMLEFAGHGQSSNGKGVGPLSVLRNTKHPAVRTTSVDDRVRPQRGLRVLVDDDAREVVLLALPNAQDQKHGHDDEAHDESPPQALGAVVETEAEP